MEALGRSEGIFPSNDESKVTSKSGRRRKGERPAERCELGMAITSPDVRGGLYFICKWELVDIFE